jgi:hypothetical protein
MSITTFKIIKRESSSRITKNGFPLQGTPYFYFESDGQIVKTFWRNNYQNIGRFLIHNYFVTKEEIDHFQMLFKEIEKIAEEDTTTTNH